MNSRIKWFIFLIPIIIICTGLLFYFTQLGGSYSTDSKDWGGFGGFINPFVTFSNVCLFVIFSLLVYRFNTSVNRPILTYQTVILGEDKFETWQIKNLGVGAAMNLIVSYKHNRNEDWIIPTVKCYSIGKDGIVNLDWLTGSVDIIGVYYKDIFDNEYVAVVGDDITEVRSLNDFKVIKINDFVFARSDLIKLKKLQSVRISEKRNKTSNSNTTQTTTSQTTVAPTNNAQ